MKSTKTKKIPCSICGTPVTVSVYTHRVYCERCRKKRYKNRPDLQASYRYKHTEKGKKAKEKDERNHKERWTKYFHSKKGWEKARERQKKYYKQKYKQSYENRYKRQKEVLDLIDDLLNEKSIREHSFYDLKDNKHLRVDGYYPNHKIILEVHGIQHYLPTTFSKKMDVYTAVENTQTYQRRDFLKQEYCLKNNLNYIVVPYKVPLSNVPKLVQDQILNKNTRIITVGKWFRFAYAHKLISNYLDELENELLFGKCNNYFGHGHNAKLYVEVKGFVDPLTGMVINFNELSRIVKKYILDVFDHKHLNLDLKTLFNNKTTTSENTLQVIWNILKPELPILNKLIFYEAENSVSELKREDI